MRQIQDYIGLPLQEGGRKYPNFDCWGLVVDAGYELFGLELPLFINDVLPNNRRSHARNIEMCLVSGIFQETMNYVEGDIICWWYGKLPVHCGLVVNYEGSLKMLHAHHRGVSVSCIEDRDTNIQCRFYRVSTKK